MAEIGNVLHPVPDVSTAVAFYGTALGLSVKFQDGDRYAALNAGHIPLALAAAGEDITGGPAASVKVESVAETVDRVLAAGGKCVAAPSRGPHETRAVVCDPWGNQFIVYASR